MTDFRAMINYCAKRWFFKTAWIMLLACLPLVILAFSTLLPGVEDQTGYHNFSFYMHHLLPFLLIAAFCFSIFLILPFVYWMRNVPFVPWMKMTFIGLLLMPCGSLLISLEFSLFLILFDYFFILVYLRKKYSEYFAEDAA